MKSLFDIGYITTHIHRVHGVIYHMTWMRVAIYLVVMPFFVTSPKQGMTGKRDASPDVGPVLAHRLRCWPSIGPALG